MLEIETAEDRPRSWIESLAMRLYVNNIQNDYSWRRHIPVIIESKGNYLNSQIYDDLNMLENSFSTIEWKGFENFLQMKNELKHIFHEQHIDLIYRNIGNNLHDVRIFTDGLVYSKKEPDFYKNLDCEGQEFELEYNKFLYKISQVYLRPEVKHLFEDGTLDHAIIDACYNLTKTDGHLIAIGPIGEEVRQKAIIKSFVEAGLLYIEKHFSTIFSRKIYVKFFSRYYKSSIKKMTPLEKLDYNRWVLFKGLHIKDMKFRESLEKYNSYSDHKNEYNWDVDLYGDHYGRRDDPGHEGFQLINRQTGRPWFYAYGKFTELAPIKYLIMPFSVFLGKAANFPFGYLHLKQKHKEEGNPEPPVSSYFFKWLERRATVYSALPQVDSEVKLGLNKEEYDRAWLKLAYLYDHPEQFKKPIKWRIIRRWAREIHMGSKSKNSKSSNDNNSS